MAVIQKVCLFNIECNLKKSVSPQGIGLDGTLWSSFRGRINKTGEWQSPQGFSSFLVDGWPFFVYGTVGQNSHVGRKRKDCFLLSRVVCVHIYGS